MGELNEVENKNEQQEQPQGATHSKKKLMSEK